VILVDTSIWIEVSPESDGVELPEAVDLEKVVTCLPVVQEILQGAGV
jgi:predicted nucleic acid-binding protein